MKNACATFAAILVLATGMAQAGDSARAGPPPDVPWQGSSIPVGSVVGFDLDACPSGWTDYAAGADRFLVGWGRPMDAGRWAARRTTP